MAVHQFKLKITNPDAWPPGAPVSNPPLYKFEFSGNKNHVHSFGHIWFGELPKPLTIQITIDKSPGFIFQTNATPGDGSAAFLTSIDPSVKLAFNGLGIFQPPALDATNTTLSFDVQYPAGPAPIPAVYYYQLNVVDTNKNPNVAVTWDPIIVNQP